MSHDNTERDWATIIKEHARKPGSYSLFSVLVDAVKQLQQTVKELRKQVSELETKSMVYEGVWQWGKTYAAGSIVTRSGSAWHTTRAMCGTPGGPEPADRDWVLLVKHGRDGPDGRDAR